MPSHSPPDTHDIDPAAAFEALRGEVSLTRHAVEGLTAARERQPDYTATLTEIASRLDAFAASMEWVEKSPAMRLTPASLTTEIVKASADARAGDLHLVHEARDAILKSAGRIDGAVDRAWSTHRQHRLLARCMAGSLLAGMLIWSVLPGAIARALPERWHVPEWMAARTLGTEQREAGRRLLATGEAMPREVRR